MKETSLQYVVRMLNERKGMMRKIAEDTKLSYGTVRLIANGSNTNPTLETLTSLVKYFKENK
jgi:DNA-binding phage protein